MQNSFFQKFYRKYYISFIFMIGYFFNLCNAQSTSLSDYQLLKFQTSSLNEIETFLKSEKWIVNLAKENQSNYYFGYSLEYNVTAFVKSNVDQLTLYHNSNKQNIIIYQPSADSFNSFLKQMKSSKGGKPKIDENFNSSIFQESTVTIEFRTYNNGSSNKYSILVYNNISLNKEIQKAKEDEIARLKFEKEQEDKYQRILEGGNDLFKQEKYRESISAYKSARRIFPDRVKIIDLIALTNKKLSQQIVENGNKQYDNTNYEGAILLYKEALKVGLNISAINDKIVDSNKQIKKVKINKLLNEASTLFLANKFHESLSKYKEVIKIDFENRVGNDRIKEINRINTILSERETKIFKYSEINNATFNGFEDNLENIINETIKKNKGGSIIFKYNIDFDKEGNNNSTLIRSSSTIKKIDKYFINYDLKSKLTPSKLGKYFVASKELINIDLSWKTSKVTYKSNYNNIKTNDLSTVSESIFKNFINKQSFRPGHYTFEIVNKKNNYEDFTDVNLVNYSVAGPESAFLSMICPGLGTLNVTQGKKGWGRLGLFLVTAGASVVTNILSDKEYQKYLGSQDQFESDAFYKKADELHKISLLSGGIAATIYIHDIIWVLSKGSQNQNKSKYLRNKVKKNPIEIRKKNIKL